MNHLFLTTLVATTVLLVSCKSKNNVNPLPLKTKSSQTAPKPQPEIVTFKPENIKNAEIFETISPKHGMQINLIVIEPVVLSKDIITWSNQNHAILDLPCNKPIPTNIKRLRCQFGTIDAKIIDSLTQLELFDTNQNSNHFTKDTYIKNDILQILGTKKSLKSLYLSDIKLQDKQLKYLQSLKNLHTLDISSNEHLTGFGLSFLASNTKLKVLNISGTQLAPQHGKHITYFSELVHLNVGQTGITDNTITTWTALKYLKVLVATNSSLTIKALNILHQLKTLERLNMGDWFHRKLKNKHMKLLTNLTNLEILDLSYTSITDEGIVHIAKLTNLQVLILDRTNITDSGMQHIQGLTKLTNLSTYKCEGITGQTLKYIKPLKNIKSLNLGGTQLKNSDLKQLASWTHINRLDLCNADHLTVEALKKYDFTHLNYDIFLTCKDEDHSCVHE